MKACLKGRTLTDWRGEWSALWKIAAPLLIAQLCYTGMAAVDTVVAGRSGLFDLAGVAVGTGLWVPLSLFLTGICYAVSPLTAKALGAQSAADSHSVLIQSQWIAFVIGVVSAMLLFFGARWTLDLFEMEPETLAAGNEYLKAIAIGLPGFCFYQALRSYLIGLGQTRPEMWTGLAWSSATSPSVPPSFLA